MKTGPAILLAAVVALSWGCGTQKAGESLGDSGGNPFLGIAGFEKVDTMPDLTNLFGRQAVVCEGPSGHRFSSPMVVDDALGYRMWMEVDAGEGIETALSRDGIEWVRHCEDGSAATQGTCPVFVPDEDWEGDDVGAPCVLEADGEYHLFYRGGGGNGIGHALSTDGIAWTRAGADGLVIEPEEGVTTAPLDGPSVVHDPDAADPSDRFRMWFVDGGSGIRFARSGDGESWTVDRLPALTCGEEGAWDQDWIGDPEVRIETLYGGRRVYRMWYTGLGDGNASIGLAASWEGTTWVKAQANPILDEYLVFTGMAGFAVDELEPAVIQDDGRHLLWFFQEQLYPNVEGIALAIER